MGAAVITVDAVITGDVVGPAQDLAKITGVLRWVFNGAEYVGYQSGDDLPQPSLANRQASKWEQIKAYREVLSDAGGYKVVVAGVDKWFHSDAKSKTQQIGLVLAGAGIPAGLQWKTMDGSFVTMTQALAGQIFQAAMAQDAAIFQAAEVHRVAMEAAADPDAYDFAAGWPVVHGG